MMEPAHLIFSDAGSRPAVVVDTSPFRIGRGHANQLDLTVETTVSRAHAEIVWDGEQFVLCDCGSRAGTFLNDVAVVERHPLTSGDRIRVGPKIELRFRLGPPGADDGMPSASSGSAIMDVRQTATLLAGLRAVGSARVLDHVLDVVLDAAISLSGAERGFIMLASPAGGLEFRRGRGPGQVDLSGRAFQTSRKVPDEVFRTGRTQMVRDLRDAPAAAEHEGTLAIGIRQVVCAPLEVIHYVALEEAEAEDRRIGVLYLDSRERQALRSPSLRDAVETLAHEAARAIEHARLYRESQEKTKLEEDLRMAQVFQQALLPAAAPTLAYVRAAASMVPCRMIGGDFFEYVTLPGGALGFTVGDVAGKGAPAGLLGARIQEIFSAHAPVLLDPSETISQINTTLLRRSLESRFVTMVYGILSPDGCLRYCNAGHNYPVLVTADGIRRLETGGLIVGLFDDATYDDATVQLSPGDLLVVFSDGISEAMNAAGEEFGDDGIIASIRDAERDPETVLARLIEAVGAFTGDEPQADDMTVLVLSYREVRDDT